MMALNLWHVLGASYNQSIFGLQKKLCDIQLLQLLILFFFYQSSMTCKSGKAGSGHNDSFCIRNKSSHHFLWFEKCVVVVKVIITTSRSCTL